MNWLTSNLYILLILGFLLFFGSFFRMRLVQPKWKCFWSGGLLLIVVGFGMYWVAIGSPGGEGTVDQIVLPKPIPPVNTHLQRLKSPWDSELNADWPVAESLASISQTAYLPPVDADPAYRLLGFDEITPIVASSMIGYVVSAGDVTVIAFRGTDVGEVSDWLANLERSAFETSNGPIHKGFYDAYQSLKSQIMTVMRNSTHKQLWITGHSLGGAIALVCAYDLIETESMQIDGLITFGQPMVARKRLTDHLNLVLLGKYAHFVNNADIVARVPPSYTHCGSLVWFTGTGIKRSKSKRIVVGAAGDTPAGDTPDDDNAVEIDEIPPITESEFQELQATMGKKPVASRLPHKPRVAQASSPYVEDHSMNLYLQKVRSMLGVTTSK